MAIQYGKTWWGLQWLNSLSNIDYDNRLSRGKSYASKGAVKSIQFYQNSIEAKVSGSRPKPYNVNIVLPPFFDPELSHFLKVLAAKPAIISKMLNGELDPEVLEIAELHGLKVFPGQWTDFKMQCSCPDWAVPCKHLAAVIYKVSAEIDNNPFLAFNLHRVNLVEELNKRGVFIEKENLAIPQITDLYFDKKPHKQKKYEERNAYQKLNFSTLQNISDELIGLLQSDPVFYTGHGDFKQKYQNKLNRITKESQKVIKGKIALEYLFFKAKKEAKTLNTHSHEKVVIDSTYKTKIFINDQSFSFIDFVYQLAQIKTAKTIDYQASTAATHTILHFATHLIANGAIVPQIVSMPNNDYAIRWLPAMLSKDVQLLLQQLENILPPDIFIWTDSNKNYITSNKHPAFNLLSLFITEIIQVLEEQNSGDTFLDLFFRKQLYPFRNPGEEALSTGIQNWLQKYYITQGQYKPQLIVEELANEKFSISVQLINMAKNVAKITLHDVLTKSKFDKKRFEILQSLSQLSMFIEGLDNYINSNGREDIIMNLETFSTFLMTAIPAIKLLDIDILLPKSLQEILKPKPTIKVRSTKSRTFLSLAQLFSFDWQVAIGDTVIDPKEFDKLLNKSEGLIKYKSQYIYVNTLELEKLHKHFTDGNEPNSFALLRAVLSGEYQGAKVRLTDEVLKLVRELTEIQELPLPKGMKATLRPYQHRGYSWMYRNAQIGFGSVIADDMGLGKTLQVITTLLKYKEDGLLKDAKVLVVAPTGLLNNWEAEIKKFAPTLRTKIFHGTGRKIDKKEPFDVIISSYGVVRSDVTTLKKMPWQSMVIDEAQNIKNINTAQAKAIKSIPAYNFIAMSGTPVENRLSELWSIMDYSNRGLLGNLQEFNKDFGNPIETFNDEAKANELKKVTAPFLMRRLKSDKAIISDLPDKIEMDCFSSLVQEQASLYEKTLEKAMKDIEGITGNDSKALFVRQSLVIQMILALKQICNHPTQYLKNNVKEAQLSGKMELLFNKLDSIVESGEKVLLFTQFTEMGKLLEHFITERYKDVPLFYHGGCTLKQRNAMVNSFQSNRADKIFILSLKAAGTGLNLTAANHVIHYDLWWNPAVEAQATDRAYRIGQKNNVVVHRFITKNTFEERINEMIQSKKALANMTVASGENWIGNLSNKELKEIFGRG